MQRRPYERQLDQEIENSFQASNPPPSTPVEGPIDATTPDDTIEEADRDTEAEQGG